MLIKEKEKCSLQGKWNSIQVWWERPHPELSRNIYASSDPWASVSLGVIQDLVPPRSRGPLGRSWSRDLFPPWRKEPWQVGPFLMWLHTAHSRTSHIADHQLLRQAFVHSLRKVPWGHLEPPSCSFSVPSSYSYNPGASLFDSAGFDSLPEVPIPQAPRLPLPHFRPQHRWMEELLQEDEGMKKRQWWLVTNGDWYRILTRWRLYAVSRGLGVRKIKLPHTLYACELPSQNLNCLICKMGGGGDRKRCLAGRLIVRVSEICMHTL